MSDSANCRTCGELINGERISCSSCDNGYTTAGSLILINFRDSPFEDDEVLAENESDVFVCFRAYEDQDLGDMLVLSEASKDERSWYRQQFATVGGWDCHNCGLQLTGEFCPHCDAEMLW